MSRSQLCQDAFHEKCQGCDCYCHHSQEVAVVETPESDSTLYEGLPKCQHCGRALFTLRIPEEHHTGKADIEYQSYCVYEGCEMFLIGKVAADDTP